MEDTFVIVPHVCNNRGVMGAGVAAALKFAFPNVDHTYVKLCESKKGDVLGHTDYAWVEDSLCISNMIAQDGFRGGMRPPIRYGALAFCMYDVADLAKSQSRKTRIIAPKFGAGLAGGDWAVIRQLIHELWLDQGIDVTIAWI
jgi:O-acetyl-ADP-ribose deacetylase (regulator of RNase III)